MIDSAKTVFDVNNNPPPHEFLILRPTRVFFERLNKLALQFTCKKRKYTLIPAKSVQTDTTIYIVPYKEDPAEVIDYIADNHLYKKIFQYEFERWFPHHPKDCEDIVNTYSYFDFYVCFNLEFHNHVLGWGKSDAKNYTMYLRPKAAAKKWLIDAMPDEDKELKNYFLKHLKLNQLAENATLVIKNLNDLNEIKPFLAKNAKEIFEFDLMRMCPDPNLWPANRNFEHLVNFYDIEIHTKIIDLLH